MQEKFRLKIERLTMYKAREKVRILGYGDWCVQSLILWVPKCNYTP